MVEKVSAWAPMGRADAMTKKAAQGIGLDGNQVWLWLWLGGAGIYLLVVMVQTRVALHRWSRERLCTDSALLDLLEDCKPEAGVTAPIGLVVSERISAPAILGWLRPRILIPGELISSLSRSQLRAVLFHELAHFRFLDVPLQWVFTLARALHWFNPFAHLACRAWARFREEAADEAAMSSMKESTGASYGEALLKAIRQAHGDTPPFGALAIGESIHHLKRRLIMINQYQSKSPRYVLAGTVLALVLVGLMLGPIRADDATDAKTVAVAAMQTWLKEIDQSQYGQSWQDASATFQKAISSDGWSAALTSVRTPLGKCTDRKLASALEQTEVPGPTGPIKGDFIVAQFNSSFENLAYAVETLCFEKAPDGTWKASGYFVKPKI
jgi:beta-lactamase regulating signal transducer with metallopeptidase domain